MNLPHAVVVFFLASMAWLTTSSCYGRAVVDVNKDGDDEWPVLCPPDTFYDRKQEICKICSLCPPNNVITNPCHGLHDTKCGPFYDYKTHLSSSGTQDGGDKASGAADDVSRDEPVQENDQSDASSSSSRFGSTDGISSQDQTATDDVDSPESEWRSLTLTLTVLISISVIVIIVIVVGICFVRRRIVNDGKKQLVCEYRPPPVEV